MDVSALELTCESSLMNTVLIGIDYIVDILDPNKATARSAAHAMARDVIGKTNRALAIARRRGWLTILVKVGFAKNYVDQPKQSPLFGRLHEYGTFALETPGTEFHPHLDIKLVDLVFVKPRVSAFYGTGLDAALRARKIDRVIIAGVSSTLAVQSAVRDAHDRDYRVMVLEDACAAANEETHRVSMDMLSVMAEITTVDEIANEPEEKTIADGIRH